MATNNKEKTDDILSNQPLCELGQEKKDAKNTGFLVKSLSGRMVHTQKDSRAFQEKKKCCKKK